MAIAFFPIDWKVIRVYVNCPAVVISDEKHVHPKTETVFAENWTFLSESTYFEGRIKGIEKNSHER